MLDIVSAALQLYSKGKRDKQEFLKDHSKSILVGALYVYIANSTKKDAFMIELQNQVEHLPDLMQFTLKWFHHHHYLASHLFKHLQNLQWNIMPVHTGCIITALNQIKQWGNLRLHWNYLPNCCRFWRILFRMAKKILILQRFHLHYWIRLNVAVKKKDIYFIY